MKFIDMFCGIGTIRMGFEQAHHECVYSIEWDKWKRKIYSIIFGGEPDGADIRTIKSIQLPEADCWCFGAPCQDFSIAGKRKGLEGDRSSLVREVFRLLRETKEEYRPKYLFYENVKGMLSSNKGLDYLEILIEMESLGYDTIEYSLLNSKDFGVPQNRERVFTIGHLRGRSTRKIFPIRGNDKKINAIQRQYTNCITRRYNEAQATGTYVIESKQYAQEVRPVLTPDRLNKRQNGRRFKEPGEPMFTLTKQDIHGIEYQGKIRRLTPKEYWRLQGIPDKITDKVIAAGISDTQMYKGAGDATTVNVIYEIAKRM
jgi:DNA (cytosine-5)-methyltransferase 1